MANGEEFRLEMEMEMGTRPHPVAKFHSQPTLVDEKLHLSCEQQMPILLMLLVVPGHWHGQCLVD